MNPVQEARGSHSDARWFATTHWSVVLMAARDAQPEAKEALEKLCQSYWYPLYAYVRRSGRSVEDAQDLTQDFFARLLEKDYLGLATPSVTDGSSGQQSDFNLLDRQPSHSFQVTSEWRIYQ